MARVLVVDDHAAIRSTLQMILEEQGYGVNSVADGARAVAALRSSHSPRWSPPSAQSPFAASAATTTCALAIHRRSSPAQWIPRDLAGRRQLRGAACRPDRLRQTAGIRQQGRDLR